MKFVKITIIFALVTILTLVSVTNSFEEMSFTHPKKHEKNSIKTVEPTEKVDDAGKPIETKALVKPHPKPTATDKVGQAIKKTIEHVKPHPKPTGKVKLDDAHIKKVTERHTAQKRRRRHRKQKTNKPKEHQLNMVPLPPSSGEHPVVETNETNKPIKTKEKPKEQSLDIPKMPGSGKKRVTKKHKTKRIPAHESGAVQQSTNPKANKKKHKRTGMERPIKERYQLMQVASRMAEINKARSGDKNEGNKNRSNQNDRNSRNQPAYEQPRNQFNHMQGQTINVSR